MKNRTLLFLLLINSLIGVAVAVWVNVFTGNELIERLKSAGVYEYRGHILIIFVVLSLISLVLIFRFEHGTGETPKAVTVPEAEIVKAKRDFLQDLMARYQTRYQHKLDGRFEISLVVSEDLEGAGEQRFDEEFSADPQTGSAAQYIIELFEKRGRLLIVGSPGVGKTVLLLKLALHLIAKAQDDANQPLPVIFNLASWSPEYKQFDDWLRAVLTQGYGLSADLAATMLREGQIVILLDGLDELARNEESDVAAEIRRKCLTALNLSLDDGSKNAVICCRREEFLAMRNLTGAEGPVAAKVAVQDLTIGQIERALIRASNSEKDRFAAGHLLAALREDRSGAFRQVLTTPFYFTLALHVFDYSEPPQIDAPDRETLERNLMKGFVKKKVQVTANKKHFSVAQLFKWLGWLARFLDARQQVVFELAHLQPKTLKRPWWGNVAYGLSTAVFIGIFVGAVINGLFGVILGFIFGLVFWSNTIKTVDIARWDFSLLLTSKGWRSILEYSGFVGLLCVVIAALLEFAYSVFRGGDFDIQRVTPGLAWGVAYGTFFGSFSVCRRISSFAKLSNPYQRIRAGILFDVLNVGCFGSAFTFFLVWFGWRHPWYLPIASFFSGAAIGFWFSPLYLHSVLRLCLTLEGSMPIRYVSFLRYATELRILEEEGGQWRFRHQNFQDYFARALKSSSL